MSGIAATTPMRLPGLLFLQVLRERKTLLYQMARRDFNNRFVGSAAGWLWTLIHPLVLLLSWVFVFQFALKVPPPPGAGNNYTLYLFCGYLPWLLFSETVQRATVSLVEQSSLITKTVFPSEIVPVSVFLSALGSHVIAVTAAAVVVKFMTGHLSVLILLLPVYAALLGLFAIGLAWLFSSLQVFLRDTAQAVIVLLTGWFWLTPIFLDETHFPPGMQWIIRWNPMAPIVKAYRQRLLSYDLPDLRELAWLVCVCTGTFIVGGLFFRHLKRGFADVL